MSNDDVTISNKEQWQQEQGSDYCSITEKMGSSSWSVLYKITTVFMLYLWFILKSDPSE